MKDVYSWRSGISYDQVRLNREKRRDDQLPKPHPIMGSAGIRHYLGVLNGRRHYDAKRANQT